MTEVNTFFTHHIQHRHRGAFFMPILRQSFGDPSAILLGQAEGMPPRCCILRPFFVPSLWVLSSFLKTHHPNNFFFSGVCVEYNMNLSRYLIIEYFFI